jgi:type III restriction enzyme
LIKAHLSQDDLFHAFELLIKVNLNGYASKRSVPTVKQALYRWFRKYLNINLDGNGITYIQNIVLNNAYEFSKLFDQAIRAYKPVKDEEVNNKIEELEQWNDDWEVPENRNLNPFTYTEKYQQKDDNETIYFESFKLNLASPCRLNIDSDIEVDFIKYLEEKANIVQWWWQNGSEHMSLNFGIKYNKKSTFQPDFIVLLKNGKLGIFDTKASGYNEDDNKLKAEALQDYIKSENKDIYGGLVIKEGQHFRINSQDNYSSFKEIPNEWDYFDEWLK